MKSPTLILQCVLLLVPIITTSAMASRHSVPRLNPLRGMNNPRLRKNLGRFPGNAAETASSEPAVDKDLQTFYYNQTLDHFNYRPDSFTTFQQRYVINFRYWGGANASAPILAYLGEEASLDFDLDGIGFLSENAPRLKALQVYIEHRYYGESIPFSSSKEASSNASTFGYFTSAQAIADYAEVLLHIKEKYQAKNSPVIVVGGSYGGMLASWFRLKYPHVAHGAVASSAPILYFGDITPQDGYYTVITKDFREVSETCYQTIKDSWAEIDRVASSSNGLSILSKKFKTCQPLEDASELKNYFDYMYSEVAQYNAPPTYPVNIVCAAIDGASAGKDILDKIFAGLVAYRRNQSCYINPPTQATETGVGWDWQTCSDMVIPIGRGNETMFEAFPFDLNGYIDYCLTTYGVPPRPNWVTTYFGGHDIKLVLKRFASNIIFSNGLKDPYSSGGVLENISKTVVAVKTAQGSHCLDILPSRDDDPKWLVKQREVELKIVKKWLSKYYADLHAYQQGKLGKGETVSVPI